MTLHGIMHIRKQLYPPISIGTAIPPGQRKVSETKLTVAEDSMHKDLGAAYKCGLFTLSPIGLDHYVWNMNKLSCGLLWIHYVVQSLHTAIVPTIC